MVYWADTLRVLGYIYPRSPSGDAWLTYRVHNGSPHCLNASLPPDAKDDDNMIRKDCIIRVHSTLLSCSGSFASLWRHETVTNPSSPSTPGGVERSGPCRQIPPSEGNSRSSFEGRKQHRLAPLAPPPRERMELTSSPLSSSTRFVL